MPSEKLLLRDVIGSFAPGQAFRAVLLLSFTFDGVWLEEALIPELFERPAHTALVIRDRNALLREAPSVRYHRADAKHSTRIFHPKLILLVAEDRALAIIGSANLTRGGLERNLEMGAAYEISEEGGSRSVFDGLLEYLSVSLAREVSGASAAALAETCVALREVLAGAAKERQPRQVFLHNYDRYLWAQLLEKLPHPYVTRVSIISPFFEPNTEKSDDPAFTAGDDSIFAKLFDDLTFDPPSGEKPVTVYFQTSEGNKTLLPVDKLKAWRDRISLRVRSSASDDARPLHAKMLVIEGARGPRRDPYLVSLHGSPNFTAAAFLSRPPDGNAEISVLTRLPWKRDGHAQVRAAMRLDTLFVEVDDWRLLRHQAPAPLVQPSPDAFMLLDVTFHVAERRLSLAWKATPAGATNALVLVELDGSWSSVGDAPLGTVAKAELTDLQQLLADEDGVLTLRAARVRVQLRDKQGAVLASAEAPLNVDCPTDFCGLAMVGPVMATLDEQIAHVGTGTPVPYREQLKFLELRRAEKNKRGNKISVLTHQADLDRFFRNLTAGFRGLRARREALPESEYTLRRNLKELAQWCGDAIHADSKVPSVECRLFLVDRIARELHQVLEDIDEGSRLYRGMPSILAELELANTVASAGRWARSLTERSTASYVRHTVQRLTSLEKQVGSLR
jgi:hypothetical protein